MLALIRRFAKTWPARALFAVLVGAFGLWGVAGRLYNQSNDTAVAHVGDSTVEMAEAEAATSRQLAQLQRQNGAGYQPSAQDRAQAAQTAVQQLIYQKLIAGEMGRLHMVVPDQAVRDETFSLGAFKGTDGNFSRAKFLQVIQANNLDEAGFIALVRSDLGRQELLGAVSAGVATPAIMLDQLFAYIHEVRIASAVSLPFAAAANVPMPTEAQLRRYWANNPQLYATPEYRRVKIVVLSPDTLARTMTVSDQDVKTFYDAAKSNYDKPELRSVEIISAPDQASAAKLTTAWQAGADWGAIQAAAKAAGATAISFDDAKQAELPDAALGRAAFAAAADTVAGPIQGAFGWYAIEVTKITPGVAVSLDQATAEIRQKVAVLKANDAIDDNVNKLEDAISGGGLDNLPAGLGAAAVEGTLDAQGNTPATSDTKGGPAPIPAFPALRDAIVDAAFQAKQGDTPELQQLPASKDDPAGAYYAVQVESVIKPSQLPYDAVSAKVAADWTADQQRRAEETVAAVLLNAVRGGTPLARAAAARGLSAVTLPPVARPNGDAPPPGVPDALVSPLFTLKPGEATMVQTPDGFVVAQLQGVQAQSPETDKIGADELGTTLKQGIGSDVTDGFVQALESQSKVSVNDAQVRRLTQQ